ncbi:radical SAM protein [uncultured Rhodospira sp.]|uniref:B12-binding domain-containing radical SAM protein n=1 Tax=uncultured Rhodospira sp. TaxID=1936189 RepID=UPI002633C5A8|nr:radical SAM protein [uncultured Rhodospira sp.]
MGVRVLLIWPNSRNEVLGWGDLGAIAEPLALEYLAAALGQAGHEAHILDLRLHPDSLTETVAAFDPHLVGVTAFSMHVRRAREIAAEVKRLHPAVRTIVGGHHATFLPEDFFTPTIDYVVSGEGTTLITSVADALDRGNAVPDPAPGLYQREEGADGSADGATDRLWAPFDGFGRNKVGEQAFRQLPRPDRTLTAADRHRYFIDAMKPIALMRTTSGCPYRCTFCSIWRAMDGHYYIQDTDAVVEELASLEEDNVFLVDDEAFINGKRMIALAEAIQRAGIRKSYFTYCRIDTLLRNREAIAAWRDIGLRRLFVGIDAISAKDLNEYRKNCDIAQVEQGLAMARELDIEIFAQFVVNTDYTKSDFKALVRFIEHNRIDYPSFTVLTPLPGTELLTDDCVIYRGEDGRPNWDLFDCQNAVTETRLKADAFRHEYRNLYRVFKGAYTQYREHNVIVQELSAADALATGHPTSAMRAGRGNLDRAVSGSPS